MGRYIKIEWQTRRLKASRKEQEKSKLHPDLRLSAEAMRVWQGVNTEREAAIEFLGQKFEAQDWRFSSKEDDVEKKNQSEAAIEEIATTLTTFGVKEPECVDQG